MPCNAFQLFRVFRSSGTSHFALQNLEFRLLQRTLLRRGRVNLLLAIVLARRALLGLGGFILQSELAGLLDDVCRDAKLWLARDCAARDVVGILLQGTFAVDWCQDFGVVGGCALDGDVEVPVAGGRAA